MAATNAILRSEVRLFRREAAAMFWILAFPSVLLCILGAIPAFRDPKQGVDGVTVIALYTNIVVITSMVMASLQSLPAVLTGYRERGILRRISTTPASPGALLAAQFVIHLTAIICSSLLALLLARIVFAVGLPSQPIGFVVTFVLAAATMLAFGSLVSSLSTNTKVAGALGTIAFFPMLFTAGMWVPVAAMPHVLRQIVEWFPMGAAARAFDQTASGSWPGAAHLVMMVAWLVVAAVIAVRSFRWE